MKKLILSFWAIIQGMFAQAFSKNVILESFEEDFTTDEIEALEDYDNEYLESIRRGSPTTAARSRAMTSVSARSPLGSRFPSVLTRRDAITGGLPLSAARNLGRNGMTFGFGTGNEVFKTENSLQIQITRTSKNIAQALPVYLFCPIGYDASYKLNTFKGLLPPGVTLTSVNYDADTQEVVQTFSDGTSTDEIRIKGMAFNYYVLLDFVKVGQGFNTDGKLRLTLNATDYQIQLNSLNFNSGQITPFGATEDAPTSNASALSPFQIQPNVYDLKTQYQASERSYLVTYFTNNYTGSATADSSFLITMTVGPRLVGQNRTLPRL